MWSYSHHFGFCYGPLHLLSSITSKNKETFILLDLTFHEGIREDATLRVLEDGGSIEVLV